jgi:glycolate oxidase FAD binding subunit
LSPHSSPHSSLESLTESIRDAARRGAPLRIRGGGSKDFYGGEPRGEVLDAAGYGGIVSYEPTELVVTARCGTPLAEVESVLEAERQCLPFEPPHFGQGATFGGCVAAGLSGPRRASAGALRDYVLGTKVIDGRGRILSFGGQVMKNVAGYDVSRLFAGSLGTLGLIAEASIKVLPRAPADLTLKMEMPEDRALEAFNRWAGQPLPISATAWHDGEVAVRLSGTAVALPAAAAKVGGEKVENGPAAAFWLGVREHEDEFFEGPEPLWRIAVPADAPPLRLAGRQLLEWGGTLRWLKSQADASVVREAAQRVRGHAALFRAAAGASRAGAVFAPLEPVALRLHRQLKAAFDPAGIFNPGRMYPEL